MASGALHRWLAHPLTRGLDIDDPATTQLRLRIIREKRFLKKLYQEWYRLIAGALPGGDQPALELGSGAGFLSEHVPNLITSDVFTCPGVELVADAHRLPFADASLRGIAMTNVLHHLCRPRDFFREAARCIAPGGAVAMIEPWVSAWSTRVYTKLHHEPFEPASAKWEFPASGPLSGANGALPWILFERDRAVFEREFSQWRIERVRPIMPLSYLLSGGVSMRSLVPGWSYGLCRAVEELPLGPARRALAMFAFIVLRRGRD